MSAWVLPLDFKTQTAIHRMYYSSRRTQPLFSHWIDCIHIVKPGAVQAMVSSFWIKLLTVQKMCEHNSKCGREFVWSDRLRSFCILFLQKQLPGRTVWMTERWTGEFKVLWIYRWLHPKMLDSLCVILATATFNKVQIRTRQFTHLFHEGKKKPCDNC